MRYDDCDDDDENVDDDDARPSLPSSITDNAVDERAVSADDSVGGRGGTRDGGGG